MNPRSALAANNLAWLLAEHGGDKERALQLAQMAKELAPEDASVSDTLGWILYQRGIYHRALALFNESAAGLPDGAPRPRARSRSRPRGSAHQARQEMDTLEQRPNLG